MAGQELPQSSGKSGVFYGYIVVVVSFCMMAVIWGTYYAFGVFFKPVLTEFGWTRAMTAGAFSLSSVVRGLLGIVMGRLNDRFGSRMVMTFCGVFLGLGYLLMPQVGAVWQLYLFYGVIIGIGMSGSWVPLLSTVARWFVKRRSLMTGIVLTGVGTGALLAPPVANRLVSAYGWPTAYIILGILVLVVVVLAAQFLKRDPSQIGQVPYGEDKEQGLKSGPEGFSLREAAHTRQFWLVFAIYLSFGFCMFAIMVHIVPHTTDLGFSAASAATVLATIGGLDIAGRIILGSTADRIGNKRVIIIGFILMVAALFWVTPARELWMLYIFAAVFGFAQGGIGMSQSPLIARIFGMRSHGLLLGVNSFGFTIGAAAGPFLAGYIFDVTGSYQVAFLISAVVGITGLILVSLLRPIRDKTGIS